ncbi:hypothetical protein KCU89_g9826, partial [Aureobasidium melanogenum]
MAALDITWLLTETAVSIRVTWLDAMMRATREGSTTCLKTIAMVGFDDATIDSLFAVLTGFLASMTTKQLLTTDSIALKVVIINISTTRHRDLVEASWNSALDNHVTLDQVLLVVLPARKSSLDMTTRKFDLDVLDELLTLGWTDFSTYLRTRMGTLVLSHLSGAWSETFDSIVENLGMATRSASMSTEETLGTWKNTATVRCKSDKIIRCRDHHLIAAVPLTRQFQRISDVSVHLE